jgi:hypothetical protein
MIEEVEFDRKLIGLWQLTKIPMLKATLNGTRVEFTWQGEHRGRPTVSLPMAMFEKLEPVELMQIVENSIQERHGVYAQQWRSDFRGFSKNPLT